MKTQTAPTTESVWRQRVRQWRESGQTAEDYARGRSFAASTLHAWSSRLGRTGETRFVCLVPKAPVRAAPALPPVPASELVVEVGGARVRVAPGFDAVLLTDVVRVLGGGAR